MRKKILFLSFKPLMDHQHGGVVATMDYLKELVEEEDLELMLFFPVEERKNKDNTDFFVNNQLNYADYKSFTAKITPKSKAVLKNARRFFEKRYYKKLRPFIKLNLSLCITDTYLFLNSETQLEIEQYIRDQQPDYIILDEIRSIFMLPSKLRFKYLFTKNRKNLPKLIYLSYNMETKVYRDVLKIHPNMKKLRYKVNLLKIILIERALFKNSDAIICISPSDRDKTMKYKAEQVFCVPPQITPGAPKNRGQNSQVILFTGSPWSPNFYAASWLSSEFAAALNELNPKARIKIIGLNQEQVATEQLGNVEFLGFVSEEELEKQLMNCSLFVSPVIHGSGTKMKMMTALKYLTPIAASSHSLQGFDFLDDQPLIEINDPKKSAQIINAIITNPARLYEMQNRLEKNISNYILKRKGLLARVIKNV